MASDREAAGDTERPDSRLRLGLETTLLAWVRTGLSLMGFGFVLARFGLFLQELSAQPNVGTRQVHASLGFGITLIVLGVAVNAAAGIMHYPFLIRTRSGETDLPQTWRLGLMLCVFAALAGIAMTILLLIMERAG
jgi:putative membrane protein